jgi:plastocyanin
MSFIFVLNLVSSLSFAEDQQEQVGSIQGTINLLGEGKKVIPAKNVIVSMTPLDEGIQLNRRPVKKFIVNMRKKVYIPSHLVVQVNDPVRFPNQDRKKHNVFSSSENNRFDLGSYKRGKGKAVTFKNPGLVKVYCNLHKRMFTYVQVMQTDRSMITSEDGFFHIKDLPKGRYTLEAWHVRGSAKRTVFVDNNALVIDVNIDGSRWTRTTRPKKDGVYPPEPQKIFNPSDWQEPDDEEEDDEYEILDDDEDEEEETTVEKKTKPRRVDDFEDF